MPNTDLLYSFLPLLLGPIKEHYDCWDNDSMVQHHSLVVALSIQGIARKINKAPAPLASYISIQKADDAMPIKNINYSDETKYNQIKQ